jgi:hypothetical protein
MVVLIRQGEEIGTTLRSRDNGGYLTREREGMEENTITATPLVNDHGKASLRIREALMCLVNDTDIDRTQANTVYHAVLSALDIETDTDKNVFCLYSATVDVFGQTVIEVLDIEADNESQAEQMVWDDLSWQDIEISFNGEALGHSGSYSGGTGWSDLDDFLNDNTEVSVEEQE